jgi:hypothetical protein
MNWFDQIVLLLTGLVAAYLVWRFWNQYRLQKAVHLPYYILGFAVLFVSGVLLIFLGYGILARPFILTVASLIPLGISMGIAEQYFPQWKRGFKWFATLGFLAIAASSFAGMVDLKRIIVPVFHGAAGLVIFLGPFLAGKAAPGFRWVGVGGALIGIGGLALASLSFGAPLLGVFTGELVLTILAPLLLLMTLAFAYGFVKDLIA